MIPKCMSQLFNSISRLVENNTCGPLRPGNMVPVILSCPPVFDKAEPVPLLSFFFFLLLWEFNKCSSCCLGEWCKLLFVSLRLVCEWILTNLTISLRAMAMLNKHLKEIKRTKRKSKLTMSTKTKLMDQERERETNRTFLFHLSKEFFSSSSPSSSLAGEN